MIRSKNPVAMQYQDATPHSLRAIILMDIKHFFQCLDAGEPVNELNVKLNLIKEKETQLIQGGGSQIAPDLSRLLHNRLAERVYRDASNFTA